MKKFYNHVLENVPRDKYEITTDMWGSNGWEVVAVHENGDCYRIFLKREREINTESHEPRD
ncbi:MAG: hypothetical protein K2N48_01540 [Muribaculaceae bacterium]|nr:hypothetical protein [Muribaculaceae bacterium]